MRLFALLYLLPLCLGSWEGRPAGPEAGSPGDKFEEVNARFLKASQAGTREEREAALEALVATLNLAAVESISGEFCRVCEQLEEEQAKARDQAAVLERRQILVEQLRARADRDDSAPSRIANEEEELKKLGETLAKLERRIEEKTPWETALSLGARRMLDAASPEKRKKAEGQILAEAQEHPEPAVRMAAAKLLGEAGGPGTAVQLQKLSETCCEQILKQQQRLPKLLGDVHKMEKRLQEEAARQNGSVGKASTEQYDAIKAEAAGVHRQIYQLGRLSDRASDAGARALSRLEGKELDSDLGAIVRALKKAKERARLNTYALLAQASSEPVRVALRGLLSAESEPLARAELIDALAAQNDVASAPVLLKTYLVDESWLVRSHCAKALARLRSREAIPALIARLESEQGRSRTDVGQALTSLTGMNFRGNLTLWQRWWQDNQASFQVPPVAEKKSAVEEARESAGLTFFGITTESQRVLFVLDLSGSMEFSMTPKNNPDDDPGRPYDFPGKDEISRLTAAKRDLAKALGGLRDGGQFNLVLFASDVWTWDDQIVTMSPETRTEVTTYIDGLTAVGGTNIYGAIARALELAGAKPGGTWSKPSIDTIYFLTDGKASVGLTTDPEEILAYVREVNRSAGIVIHTIGLSGAQDAQLLRRLAEENGGTYVAR
jgi:VWA domain-containing protein/HEAT repeat protein